MKRQNLLDAFIELWPYLAVAYLLWLELGRQAAPAPVVYVVVEVPEVAAPVTPAAPVQEAAYGPN